MSRKEGEKDNWSRKKGIGTDGKEEESGKNDDKNLRTKRDRDMMSEVWTTITIR